jgi:Ca-activated chloride channel homolog
MNVTLWHIHLQHPAGLAALLLLPWLLWHRRSKKHVPRVLVHPAAAWLRQSFNASIPRPTLMRWLMAGVWVLWSMALAQPQWVNGQSSESRYGRDIMLAVDLSGSMAIHDFSSSGFSISRLDAIKQVLVPFIEERSADRLGLVVFGEQAYVQTPLTYDHGLVQHLLNQTETGLVGDRTAIGNAIALAVKHLKHAADERKAGGGQVIVLLTDGRNNAGSITPEHAASMARSLGIRIYTIGVGGVGAEGSEDGLNEPELKALAADTHGKYFRATDSAALARIAVEINSLEKVKDEHTVYFDVRELYPYFACAGFLLFLFILVRAQALAALP